MDRAVQTDRTSAHQKWRLAGSVCLVLLLHVSLFTLLNQRPVKALKTDVEFLNVALVTLPRPELPEAPAVEPIPKEIAPEPTPEITTEDNIEVLKKTLTTTPPTFEPNADPSLGQDRTGIVIDIPDRWKLPPGARTSLENTQQADNPLAASLRCLKGFETECADFRKDIFAAEQLTETDLVWMPSYAHSGLSDSDLYGLSEAEIRQKLGIPTAGQNGVFIPFTNIGLDGGWWDTLNGVNKGCTYTFEIAAATSENSGSRELRKTCPELRKGAKDRSLTRRRTEFDRQP